MTTVHIDQAAGCDGIVTVTATLTGAAPGETHTITSASSYGDLWGDTSGHAVAFTDNAATFTVHAAPGTYTVHVTLGVDGARETNGEATVTVPAACEATTTTTSTPEETTTTSSTPTLSTPPITIPPVVESSVPIVAPPTTEGVVIIPPAIVTVPPAVTGSVITLPRTGAGDHAGTLTGAGLLTLVGVGLVLVTRIREGRHARA